MLLVGTFLRFDKIMKISHLLAIIKITVTLFEKVQWSSHDIKGLLVPEIDYRLIKPICI